MTLEVKGLRYSYKKNEVLKGVDFAADSGQSVYVLGENGAGKTTMFRCLLKLLDDYRGDILIDGESGKKLSIREMAKKIAYIPQAHMPAFNYSVFETVLMGTSAQLEGFSSPGTAEREVALEMLQLMGVLRFAERGYAELSGGERQLVLIARALAQKSKILIMDEPTANLDYGNQFRVIKRIKNLAAKGYLVILSTHNPEHALLFADNVLVLKNGKAAFFGKPEKVLTPDVIEDIYGVPVELESVSAKSGVVPVFIPNFG